jgi:hypothetical protein
MRAPIAPSIEVNAPNSSERKDSSFDVGNNAPKLQRRRFREILKGVDVVSRSEPHGSYQTSSDGRVERSTSYLPRRTP